MSITIGTRVKWIRGGKEGTEGTVIGFSAQDPSRPIVKADNGRTHGSPWGITPSNLEVIGEGSAVPPPPATAAAPPAPPGAADHRRTKLRDRIQVEYVRLAESCTGRMENTPKRLAQAMRMRVERDHTGRMLHLLDACPGDVELTYASLAHATHRKRTPVSNGYHGYDVETDEWSHPDDPLLRWWPGEDSERRRQTELERALAAVRNRDIPGFFPTPETLAQRVCALANIQPGDLVLEPSAGFGSLADAAKAAGGHVHCVELHPELQQILKLKGHKVMADDFLSHAPSVLYDRIVMNPPFERHADCLHIQHAWKFLRPGGTLVAIVSASVLTSDQKTAVEFRTWAESLPCDVQVEENPSGTFQGAEAFRQTGVASVTLVFRKPAA